MINKNQLEESVRAAGAFIGLLNETGDGYTVNTGFFKNAGEVLQQCGQRMNHLVDLFFDVLNNTQAGPPAGNPPVFDTATWLMIQNPLTSGQSPFYIVVPAQDAGGYAPESGQIGIGALMGVQYPITHFAAEVYIYIPLFNYSSTGTSFLLGQEGVSLQVGLNINKTDLFSSQSGGGYVSFSGVNIAANIFFSDKAPGLKLLFENLEGTSEPAEYDTLQALLTPNVNDWLGTALLNNVIVRNWLQKNILEALPVNPNLSVTLGSLLAAAGFIKSSDPQNPVDPFATYTLTLDTLPKDPKQIALNFLFGMLDTLNGQPLVKLPGGNIFIAAREDPDDASAYQYGLGVRMEMPLNNGDGAKSTKPSVTLCLGAWLSGETDTDSWMKRSGAPTGLTDGLMVWFINNKKVNGNNVTSFSPGFSLSSIGVNITGGAEKPLFSIDGYTLKGAELRATLDAAELLHPSTWTFGFAAKLDQIGFPLVPPGSGNGGSKSNPVAKSLLQSNNSSGTQNDPPPGDQTPVNPTFGLAVSWYLNGNFDLQLFDAKDQPDDTVVFPINRTLGPLTCEQIGIGWVNSTHILSILFDGSVMLGPLNISLQGLTVGVPITAPTHLDEYSLDLQGMGISFNAGAVSLTGAFIKIPPSGTQQYTEYAGAVAIKAGPFAISALGAYAYLPAIAPQTNGFASLFIFGVLDAPLGGPEFFFITGIAAGFGYNRAINLPDQNSVPDFPFVAMLDDPSKFGPSSDLTGMLKQIDSYVPPERGEYWLAAGIRFTSFDLVHSTALLSVEFGNELEIGVLGTSWVALPPPPSTVRFAFVELAIDIQILPDKGIISVTAILTPNSFVIAPDCHLTGGFAFYVWFGNNPHAGQFVLTVGGYHPRFKAPDYYPQVPRLGFNWNVSSVVVISGNSYFTLTSSAIMAGGGLSIVFHAGPIKAWFIAQMDALVQWAPFQYDLDISVDIGIQLKLDLLFFTITITLELGAALEIWGPGMGGKARISLVIVSFTVHFGDDPPSANATINWDDFASNLLPNKKPAQQNGSALIPSLPGAQDDAPTPAVLTITVVSGLQKMWTDENTNTAYWIVRPAGFAFAAQTAFPATELTVSAAHGETVTSWKAGYDEVHVRPLAAKLSSSVMNVALVNEDDGNVYSLFANFDLDTAVTTVPSAKWGEHIPPKANGMAGDPEMNSFLTGRLMGFKSITPKTVTLTPNGSSALNIDATIAFADIVVDPDDEHHLPLSNNEPPVGTILQAEGARSWNVIETALKDATVTAARTNIFNLLVQQFGINPVSNDNLEQSKFTQQPGAYLNGYPLITFKIKLPVT